MSVGASHATAWRAAPLALALALASCIPTFGRSPSRPPSPLLTATPVATSLRLLEAEDVQTLDPALINDPVSRSVGSELFEGLTRLDATNRPVPGLAERWDVADQGKTYTFHLRTARYQSGEPVQAQDAVATWTRALGPVLASPLTTFLAPLGARFPGDQPKGVEVVDPRTLRVRLSAPDSEFLTLLALPPYWLYDPGRAGAGFGSQPTDAGSGPYRLERWERGKRLSLRSSGLHWDTAPSVVSIDIDIVPDRDARLERFRSGSVDIIHGLSGLQALAWARDPAQAAQLHLVPTASVTWLAFNAAGGYAAGVRSALAQALDRQRLTDLALFGSMLGTPANDLVPAGIPGHLDRTLPAYDPAAARRALDAGGLQGTIDLYISTGSTVGRVARDLQEQLQEVSGRTVAVHPVGDFFKRASLGDFPVFIDTWSADLPHPADLLENILRSDGQFNLLQLRDPVIDGALDEGRAAPTFDAALAAYQRAAQAVLGSARLIPLYFGTEPYLVRSGLRVAFRGGPVAFRWEEVR